MELLTQFSGELIKLTLVGGAIGCALVFTLAKLIDSGICDDKKMEEYYKNKRNELESE